MNPSRRTLFLLAAVLLLPWAVRAERLERTFPVTGDTVVEVRNLNGQVEIRAWDEAKVRVVAVRRSAAVETHFDQAGNRIHIHTHLIQTSAPASERVVDYQIWAPFDADLNVHVEAGSVQVENFSEDVSVEAVAATVLLRNLSGHTSAKTLNGSVQAERCSGRLEMTSISGTLRFRDINSRNLVANTTSGDIFFEGAFTAGGSYNFQNHEGSIELSVPANASFELSAVSVQGQVVNEFPLTPRSPGRFAPPRGVQSLLGTVQSGAADVHATSFSGRIRVRKR